MIGSPWPWIVGLRAMAQRLGWGVADQAVSSLNNFLLGIFVIRLLGPLDFGSFSVAYVTYTVVLNAARGLGTDPLLVRHSGAPDERWRRAVASATATSTVVGVVAALGFVALVPVLPGSLQGAFLALAVGLPGLMLQDSSRFAFFSIGRAGRAVVNDAIWGLLQVAMLLGLYFSGHVGVVQCMLVMGISGTCAALFGLKQTGVMPDFSSVVRWVVDHRSLGSRYLVENLTLGGSRQVRVVLLGSFAGLAAVGEVRAAEMLMGPFLVILMGASQVAVPEGVRVLSRSPQRLTRFCLGIGVAEGVAALCWGLLLLLLLPLGLGDLILGPAWTAAAFLLPAVIIAMGMAAFETGAMAGVRALGASSRSLFAQLFAAALHVVGGGAGALVGGANGSCWGVAVAGVVSATIWWVQLHRGVHDYIRRVPTRRAHTAQVPEVA